MIGDDIEVIVLDLMESQVKLGFVHRREVYLAIQSENAQAAAAAQIDALTDLIQR